MNITLTNEQRSDDEELFEYIAHTWNKKQILGVMGYLNNLVGCLALKYQAIQKITIKVEGNRKQIHQLVYGRFINLVEQSETEEGVRVSVPISYTTEYLKEHWQGSYHSPTWIRKTRRLLSQLGIFEFVQQLPAQGENQPSASYKKFNVVKALMFYNWLEDYYKEQGHPIEDMPLHKGVTMSLMIQPILDHLFNLLVPRETPNPPVQLREEWHRYIADCEQIGRWPSRYEFRDFYFGKTVSWSDLSSFLNMPQELLDLARELNLGTIQDRCPEDV